ncbi:replication initiation factor domain-containing protein [Ideonella sp.]|uniref:replication initiation factor domain-containing protein n=1 Tax=Ideonella sp. TaxID=1929293 RepID=UPI00351BACEE
MTPAKPISDGQRIRWTLEQQAQQTQAGVRIDWLRFTVPVSTVVDPSEPLPLDAKGLSILDQAGRDLVREARGIGDEAIRLGAMAISRMGALKLVECLGVFDVGATEDKGMDYYAARTPLLYQGEAVGMVLAGASDKNKSGGNQSSTVHVNLFGSAFLHISPEKAQDLRPWIACGGWITRVDLSFDVFAGFDVADVQQAYLDGEFKVRGKQPNQQNIGSWALGHSRTFQVGSRDTGKLARFYEKGDQLFGPEAADPWVRAEVEFRSNHRVIDLDVLTRPADFFAGAYAFCEDLLHAYRDQFEAARIATTPEVKDKTSDAAVTRFVRWSMNTAGPAIAHLFWKAPDVLAELVERESHRLPRRFRGFTPGDIAASFHKVAVALVPASVPPNFGTA